MSDKEILLNFKSNINQQYGEKSLSDKFNFINYKEISDLLAQHSSNHEKIIEISHYFTPILDNIQANQKFFFTDDDSQAMLRYFTNKDIEVYHLPITYAGFDKFNKNKQFDIAFSFLGLRYTQIFENMKYFLSLLKIGGIMLIVTPSYWFNRDNLTETEKKILQYSKQNDKKWLFAEDIKPIIEKNSSILVKSQVLQTKFKTNRRDLAFLSELTKLYNAENTNDISILDITDIPADNIEIPLVGIVIQKKEEILDKNNLFKI